ncbi:Rne/Rng family ribonuclease [Curtobacterium caseinilyticum]|uniref:Rne/Rng family ribonuclease n=1 Tax=Curtobacterium caseinilyticum TaxID=3055137 RepID=A0ABT7TUD5_9MICO|nr:Rne/Rng family ribonuclease [Curtobacterium caseinilyticum]MDM7892439.1 Rne/Rng family ribonuclease [Curtobacterium caseinilyticum]
MVEQNTDNPNNEEVAPKRRGRLFGSRRARSTGQEARGDVDETTQDVETVALTDDAPSDEQVGVDEVAAADESIAPTSPDAVPASAEVPVPVEVEQVASSTAEPQDVSTVTGSQPVVGSSAAGSTADVVTAAATHATTTEPATAAAVPAAGSTPATEATPASRPEPESAPDAGETTAPEAFVPKATSTLSLIFHAPVLPALPDRPFRAERDDEPDDEDDDEQGHGRRRSRRRGSSADRQERGVREPRDHQEPRRREREREREPELITEPQRIKGSTRLEAKKQRRRDGRDAGRRRTVITEDEFLARRESVDRQMIVRSSSSKIEIGVLEDNVLAEHYVTKSHNVSLIGNVYLGKVQNVLPSMEAAFVDIGRGRNAVLYAGEVDWNSVDTGNHGRRIEAALKPGDKVLVQVTKDPVGHKGARLTSQVSLPGRYLVYVPNGSMNGISRKLPDTERARLKKILKEVLPEHAGVIVRTAAEGATEEQLTRDVQRLTSQWDAIQKKVANGQAPVMLHSEPDLLVKIVRDVFNEDFTKLIIDGDAARGVIEDYLDAVAPDLKDRVEVYDGPDSFEEYRLNEQIEKALDRKVWLPSGGSLVIDRTEAMTVVDVNTGKFVGSGGNLEETVTKNNLEAAEEIVRQLRLRDIGGIIVIDFIDMVLESNRDLVLRRLVECLSRDRTKHQVAEVTSLGLVQMTRKKIGVGLRESLDEVNAKVNDNNADPGPSKGRRKSRGNAGANGGNGNGGSSGGSGNGSTGGNAQSSQAHQITEDVKNALSRIAASTLPHEEAAAGVTGVAAPRGGAGSASAASPVSAASPTSAPEQSAAPDQAASPQADGQDGAGQHGEQSSGSKRRRRRGGRGAGSAGGEQAAASGQTASDDQASSGDQAPQAPQASVADTAAQAPSASTAPSAVAEPEAAPAKSAAPARRRVSSSAPVTPSENTVAILDIPVAVTKREPRQVRDDAESLLDSVLQALPEPKQPGQGRSRSRRVSSPSISAPASSGDDAQDDGSVIVGS